MIVLYLYVEKIIFFKDKGDPPTTYLINVDGKLILTLPLQFVQSQGRWETFSLQFIERIHGIHNIQ
jgi:hypothetical protein